MPQASHSKYLASRFAGNRQYFRGSHWLKNWKWFLCWCVMGVALAGLYFSWNDRPWLNAQTTHGELASVHALWENKCDVCHREFNLENASFNSVMSPDKRWLDLNCTSCHTPPDHTRQAEWSKHQSQSCASCHHDHQGRGHSLVRIPDSNCVQCHANLSTITAKLEHANEGASVANSITSFADHPEFRSVSGPDAYQRKMNFSHALHMTPGIVYQANQKNPVTLKDIPAEYRDFYKQPQQTEGIVQLDCASCHQLDSQRGTMNDKKRVGSKLGLEKLAGTHRADSNSGLSLPPPGEGAYYLPIQFSVHCQACHSLQTIHPLPDKDNKPRNMNIPHHLQPAELEKYLRDVLSADLLAQETPSDPKNRTVRRLDNNDQISQALRQKIHSKVDELIAKVEKTIYDEPTEEIRAKQRLGGSNCMHCHLSAPSGFEEPVRVGSKRLPIIPPRVPTVWNAKARFNHISHRAVSCIDCHEGTMPTGASGPYVEKEPLHLPGKQNCIQCHGPLQRDTKSDRVFGGVRYGCTDCHLYHNQDHPLQGPGSAWRDTANPKLTIQQFLRGALKKSKDEAKSEDKK